MNKYKYVVVFIKYRNQILMLNRNKPYWQGMWNAVGGKIEENENPLSAALREVMEETGIKLNNDNLEYLTDLSWYQDEEYCGGTYCFLAEVDEKITTPLATREGILEWKDIAWIMSDKNRGIVPDVSYVLEEMFKKEFCEIIAYYDHKDILINIKKRGKNQK